MKELFSAFGSEVFRPLVTLIAPGAIAISTWLIGAAQRSEPLVSLIARNHIEFAFTIVLVMLIVGLVLEDLGSTIEAKLFDRWIANAARHRQEWYCYLRHAFKVEPVGHRYLRGLVLRMKFELGAGLGLIVAAPGFVLVRLSELAIAASLLASASIAIYLVFYEARQTHELLSRLRHELLQGFTVVG